MISLKRTIAQLQFLQLLALALPIVVQPWLAQHLGPFAYGRLVFVAALSAYFALFCDFGFGWSATRQIAVHRSNQQRCSELVCTTLAAKVLLCTLGFVILLVLTQLVDALRREASLLLTAYVGVVGAALSPSWYFQATERPQVGYYLDILGRTLSMALVIAAVAGPADLRLAVSALAAGQLLTGLLGIALLVRESEVRWIVPRLRGFLATLWQGTPLFLSTSAVSLYTAASAVVLGLVSTREEVAYFGAAQRIVAAGSVALNPFNQIFYPRLSFQMRHSPVQAARSITTALWMQGTVGLLLGAGIFVFADDLTRVLFGSSLAPAALSLKWMAPIPFLVAVASVFANLVMMTLHRDRLHLAMTLTAAILNVVAVVLLARSYGSPGAAVALLAAETFVVLFAATVGGYLLAKLPRDAQP